MPIYTVQAPDGKTYDIQGPEGATAEQLAFVIKGGAKPAATQRIDPTEGMSGTEKFLAGVGKAFVDAGRGAGQLVGLVDRKDIEEARKLDAPLMNTGAGAAGNFAGTLATVAPTVLMPGAATLRGAAAIGAAQGLLQPSTSTGETAANVGFGGAAGAGGVALGRAAAGLWQGGKALIEPFTEAGRNRIAGRTLERFAADPVNISRGTNTPTLTGALPTLAEQTGDAGLARLQDSLRALDPQLNNQILGRLTDNNAARVAALQSLAGDSAQRGAAVAAREAASAPLYQQAFGKTIEVTPELQALLSRPSVQQATARAANIAKEEGRTFGLSPATKGAPGQAFTDANGNTLFTTGTQGQPGQITGQTLQDLKMGLDALLKDPTSGIAGKEAVNVKATRDALVRYMEQQIPEFNAARTAYAAGSKPINAMDIGEYLANKGMSATSDLAGNPRMQANSLLRTLQDPKGLMEKATGRKGLGNSLDAALTPDQMALLNAVANETDRAAAVATAGNGPGSATAQRMASGNVLRQLVGPTGLPQSWAESALANTVVGKPLNLLYGGVAEPKIQNALAQAVLEPATASRMVQAARASAPKGNALWRLAASLGGIVPSSAVASRER